MTTVAVSGLPDPVVIKEKIRRKALRPLMSNFSSLAEAIFELVDNAFDGYYQFYGQHKLEIRVTVEKDHISVINVGGRGMGPEELEQWLEWGQSTGPDGGIHEYGQGGKAAMGYLGNAWDVQTKRNDKPWLWELNETDWADTQSDEKEYTARPKHAPSQLEGRGYCSIRITKLHSRRQNLKKLKEQLSNVYRTLLKEGHSEIFLNGEAISSLALPIYDGYKIQKFQEKTPMGWWVKGWVGRLKRESRSAVTIRGGMRVTRARRLIVEGEYFGHPDFRYKASLNSLIGEVEFPKVPVLPNKTNFDRDCDDWANCQAILFTILEPHIRELLAQKEEQIVTPEEKKLVQDVREKMIQAVQNLASDDSADGENSERAGRQPPSPRDNPRKPVENPQGPRDPYSPKTPAPENPVGGLKRLKGMPPWRIDVLDPQFRSDWRDDDKKRVLIINKTFPLYERWKGDGLYIAETAALELSNPQIGESMKVSDYLTDVNRIMTEFCRVWAT